MGIGRPAIGQIFAALAGFAACFAPALRAAEPTSAPPASNAETAYEQIVAPIFGARCASCHGEEKQKGGLALHTWDDVELGGDTGPLWVAGKPSESELVRRLRLPPDDDEHMPPTEEPQLAPEEIALLERWIERGAAHTHSLAELELSPKLAAAAGVLKEKLAELDTAKAHGDPLWEFDAAAVKASRAPFAAKFEELRRRFPGALSYESRTSPALHFTAAGLGRAFGDEELAALAAVGGELTALDLAGTAVTDASAGVLAKFAQLRALRLGFTAVGDATAAALAALEKLESLALHDTRVTAECVPALEKIASLRRLYLANTPAEERAREANLPAEDAGVKTFAPVAAETAPEPDATRR